jgi:chromosome segregation ATPase
MGWVEMAGLILGSGTLGVVATRIVEARKVKLEHVREVRASKVSEAAKTVQDLREMLQAERQLVQEQMEKLLTERRGHLDCLGRVATGEGRVAAMEGELATIRREHAQCPGKISRLEAQVAEIPKLEAQVAELRDQILERYVKHPPGVTVVPPPLGIRRPRPPRE